MPNSNFQRPSRLKLKTYSHLLDKRRMPTEYELVSSRLHYYVGRGFEVEVPMAPWYRQYQTDSPLRCGDWEQFSDPRQTTYSRYTQLQHSKEVFVDGLFQLVEDTAYDRTLPEAWCGHLARAVAPLRYPFHGFQMVAAYVGAMAPGGRITIAAALQAADERRRVERIAYRVRLLQREHPDFGADSRALWEHDPLWQPLREAVERLLVTWDWGEALTALNLCLKPLIDALFMCHVARTAREHGDYVLSELFHSLEEDCRWHRDWTTALVLVALRDRPENSEAISRWIESWSKLAWQAVMGFAPLFGPDFNTVLVELKGNYRRYLQAMDLREPSLLDDRSSQ